VLVIASRMIVANGKTTPDIVILKVPNPNPKISPFIEKSTVLRLRYPNIIKSKKPSIDIESIGLKNKF
jgi:hypothetical protein